MKALKVGKGIKEVKMKNPAIDAQGVKWWFVNNCLHVKDGLVINRGHKEWYLNGKKIPKDLHVKLTVGDIKDLPLYLGMGFDDYISERLKG